MSFRVHYVLLPCAFVLACDAHADRPDAGGPDGDTTSSVGGADAAAADGPRADGGRAGDVADSATADAAGGSDAGPGPAFEAGSSFDGTPDQRSDGGVSLFPLRAEGRHLVDARGKPFLLIGDSPHSLIANYSAADAETYFADRAARGFNAAWVQLLGSPYVGGRDDGSTYDGLKPFLAYSTIGGVLTPDVSRPNPVYFQRADDMIKIAARHGILVMLDPLDTGGWVYTSPVLQSNGTAKAAAFGQYIGSRYASFPNVLWVNGNDFQNWSDAAADAVVLALAGGIRQSDPGHLQTIELNNPTSGSLDDPSWASFVDVNLSYSYCPTYLQVLADYNRAGASKPVFFGEGVYEFETGGLDHVSTPYDLRLLEYWSLLSGAAGTTYGNKYVWTEDIVAKNPAFLDSPGALQMSNVVALFAPRAWQDLVPDQAHAVLTGGYGTPGALCDQIDRNDYATAAATPDGSLGLAYLPTVRTVTVDMARFSGPATVRWYDPTSGTYAVVGTFPNAGTRQFTPATSNAAGDTDWVLVVEIGH